MWLLDNLALAPSVLLNLALSLVNVSNFVHLRTSGLNLSRFRNDLLRVRLNLRGGLG